MFIFDIDGVIADVTHLLPLIDFSNHEVTDEMYEDFLNEKGFFKDPEPSYGFEIETQVWIKKDRSIWFYAQAFDEDSLVYASDAVDEFTRNYSDEFKSRKDVDKYIINTSTDWKEAKERAFDEYYRRISEAVPIEGGKILGQGLKMHKVVFITGRRESSRFDTVKWLRRHFKPMQRHDCLLYMRPDGDERPAHEVKRDLFVQMQKDYFNANHWPRTVEASDIVVFEDDRRCVEMYKQLGCYVNHVKHDKARS